ncbi:MAG: hypothetical protein B7Y99_02555 [Caulobacterales bacterium 32-69-10]|nr:MAG: hypothetical protein B7Y99_02555 [Caulobacterales bacterium 32-69-10]
MGLGANKVANFAAGGAAALNSLDEQKLTKIVAFSIVAVGAAMVVSSAMAGTDTTFDPATAQVEGMIKGSLGKLVTVASVGVAMVNIVTAFNWKVIGSCLAVGVTAGLGPDILGGFVTALV